MLDPREVLEFFEHHDARKVADAQKRFANSQLSKNQVSLMVRGLHYAGLLTAYGHHSAGRSARYVLSDAARNLIHGAN